MEASRQRSDTPHSVGLLWTSDQLDAENPPDNTQLSRNERNEMIKQIKDTGGKWPTTNETLVNNYLQFFIKFVKSIDLQICNDALL
jgi:hypothetical protein